MGVRGRRSDNRLIAERLHWRPTQRLMDGLEKTYAWIESQLLRSAA
jgi:nucleoside-diphosphate-sugar epimerase